MGGDDVLFVEVENTLAAREEFAHENAAKVQNDQGDRHEQHAIGVAGGEHGGNDDDGEGGNLPFAQVGFD